MRSGQKQQLTASLWLILFSIVVWTGCKPDQGQPVPDYEVTIDIMKPLSGAVFMSEDQMSISIDFDNADIIHNVSVKLINQTASDTINLFEDHVHEQSGHFEFRDNFTVSSSVASDWIIVASSWAMIDNPTPAQIISEQSDFRVVP